MYHTKNDRQLHFVRVGENQGVFRSVPCGVEAKGIRVAGGDGRQRAVTLVRPFPARVPDVQRLGEDIVIDQSSEHGEHAHEKDDIATAVQFGYLRQNAEFPLKTPVHLLEERSKHFSNINLLDLLLVENHRRCGQSDEDTMAQITEHDSEQEGECHNGEQARIDFLIGSNAIAIDDGLEAFRELVDTVESWGLLCRVKLLEDRWDTCLRNLLSSGSF